MSNEQLGLRTHKSPERDGTIIDHNEAQAELWEKGTTINHNAATRNCGKKAQ